MKLRLEQGDVDGTYLLVQADRRLKRPKDLLFQTDWDYPSLASNFGFVPCECGRTDGTINCEHKTAGEMICAAAEYLDNHIGEVITDPGYFDG